MSAAESQAGKLEPLTVVALQPINLEERAKVAVRRARVPGGWLLITSAFLIGDVELSIAVASTFVPDESGAWLDTVER